MLSSEFDYLGKMLVDKSIISSEQLDHALNRQKSVEKKLGELLVEMKAVNENILIDVLGEQLNFSVARDRDYYTAEPDLIAKVPEDFAKTNKVIPLWNKEEKIWVAMADPENLEVLDHLTKILEGEVKPVLGVPHEIERAIDKQYGSLQSSGEVDTLLTGLNFEISDEESDNEGDTALARKEVDDAPIVKLVNVMLEKALEERATDIHVEPGHRQLYIRFRVDGALREGITAPIKSHKGIISRIKIMSKLNIAENRLPQDGRFTLKTGDGRREVDVRVSVVPGTLGEKVVLRLLDKGLFELDLTHLGFSQGQMKLFGKAIRKPYGIIIISGPTGSGKSTSLYAAIKAIQSAEDNIVTVEDPVEYQLEGITQIATRDNIGLTFANTLRAILRQDPDKILIGEIRDHETADIALKFSMTGHLVFTTLHANDSASTISRLVDIGVPPFIAGSSLIMVMAQRLVRRICNECKTEYQPTEEEWELLGVPEKNRQQRVYVGKGCGKCKNTGYFGRVGIFEPLVIDKKIRNLIFNSANQDVIKAAALENNMTTLRDSALEKLFSGITSVKEVLKSTIEEI